MAAVLGRLRAVCHAERERSRAAGRSGGTVLAAAVVGAAATVLGTWMLKKLDPSMATTAATGVFAGGAFLVAAVARREGALHPVMMAAAGLMTASMFVPLLWVSPTVWGSEFLPKIGPYVPVFTALLVVIAPRNDRYLLIAAIILAGSSLLASLT